MSLKLSTSFESSAKEKPVIKVNKKMTFKSNTKIKTVKKKK